MIFVTLGTHEQPFPRALEVVLPLAATHRLVVQHGYTPARDAALGISWMTFTGYDELVALMREASAVICHAGVGTIMTALGAGKNPVVIPRLASLQEHVDDHQLQITKKLAERQAVIPYLPDDDLAEALRASCVLRTQTPLQPSVIRDAIREAASTRGSQRARVGKNQPQRS